MQKPRPGTKKPNDPKTSPPKVMTIESINLQEEKIPPATNPASSILKKKPSPSKSTVPSPPLLRETVDAIADSLSLPKQTLSIHDQTKLNKKADSLLSAIKQEQTKIKNTSKGSAPNDSLSPVLYAKSPTAQPTPLLQDQKEEDKSLELGISHSQIPTDLAPVSIEDHLGPTFKTTDPKSIMDSIEQDLSDIMSGYGLSDFGFWRCSWHTKKLVLLYLSKPNERMSTFGKSTSRRITQFEGTFSSKNKQSRIDKLIFTIVSSVG